MALGLWSQKCQKMHLKKLNLNFLPRNHDPFTKNNPQIILGGVCCRTYFLFIEQHRVTEQKEVASTH